MPTPTVLTLPEHPKDPYARRSILLVVYAPFGGDRSLSTYPSGTFINLAQHPLYTSLLEVAALGVHVCALIDLADHSSYLVEIEAGKPEGVKTTTRWKQRMDSPHTLAGFLSHAHQWQPKAALVLAVEGHGAGYWPELDGKKLAAQQAAGSGSAFDWVIRRRGATFEDQQNVPAQNIFGAPTLTMGINTLPPDVPGAPGVELPMSTWGLGAALRMANEAGVPKLRVIHFNNCFNMSAEVLHTVAHHADYATGYPNYNFFTSGQTYPVVFDKLRLQPDGFARLANLFASENETYLDARPNHPTVGCMVDLTKMEDVAAHLSKLADALVNAMRDPTPQTRREVVDAIKDAIEKAQQYDSDANNVLEVPDELSDLGALAHELSRAFSLPQLVRDAADGLLVALKTCKGYVYRDSGVPWMNFDPPNPGRWDFSSEHLVMNIFLPDPLLEGSWDWRSPYYLEANPGPDSPQRHAINFPAVTNWLDFIIEYHGDIPFKGMKRPRLPTFPVFNPKWETPPSTCGKDEPTPNSKTSKNQAT